MSFSAAPTESFDVIVVGGGDRSFTAGMSAADHDHVEGFGGGGAEAHGFIIRFWSRVGISSEVEVLQ